MPVSPRNIILLKGHSAGVGDLLRSAAAWRALKNRFPEARLHLVFLTQESGAASEELIARHPLLASFHVREKWPTDWAAWRAGRTWFLDVVRRCGGDLLIDFEPSGIRTSLLAAWARLRTGISTVGIAEVPGRGWFYGRAAPSRERYAQRWGLPRPMNYADLDFVALAALGIARGGLAIELEETADALAFRSQLRSRRGLPASLPLIGLNVGCGTEGALDRRPDLTLLRAWMARVQAEWRCALLLTGAPYERAVNAELLDGYQPPEGLPALNLAGETRLIELPGLIRACCLFVSGDSGPYHVAVALRVPTVVIFNREFPQAEHHHPWVRSVIAPSVAELPGLESAVRSLRVAYPAMDGRQA